MGRRDMKMGLLMDMPGATSIINRRVHQKRKKGQWKNHGSNLSIAASPKAPQHCTLVSVCFCKQRLEWDPYEDLFRPGLDAQPRNVANRPPEPRSWYGPDGRLVRELPCPNCRGRGNVICPRCDMGSPEASCSECLGKGMKTCSQCLGEHVVWEESLDEVAWEKVNLRSPLRVPDDEMIESMEIQLAPKRKSKRVYGPLSVEVREKISNSLKKLNATTGSISKRIRRILNDPVLNAKRIEAIKRAKNTDTSKQHIAEKQRIYFQNPENRIQRGRRMRGIDFFCSSCGKQGHRRNRCPSIPEEEREKCSLRVYKCSFCGESGHYHKTCPLKPGNKDKSMKKKCRKKRYRCKICLKKGHNSKTCPSKKIETRL